MGLQSCGLNLDQSYKELQPHGTLEFPCAGYSSDYTDNADDVIPWHWHEEMEIIHLKEGRMKLQIQGKTVYLNRGEGYVINSNMLHFAAAEPFCTLHSLVFHPLLITGNSDSVFATKYMTPLLRCSSFDGCALEEVSGFVTAFEALSGDQPGFEFVVRENLSAIVRALCRAYAQEIKAGGAELGQDSIRMRKMLDYVHRHYTENLELWQIAREADIGERECLRCFQRMIQVSPMQYLLKYRVMRGASFLLRNPAGTIAEIASRCGFDSPSNFSHMFKRYFRCTPKEYRKKNGPDF